jgi:hypothetical protein
MQHIATPSISALESIMPELLLQVSGGCGKKRRCCRQPPPSQPPVPPLQGAQAQMMGTPPQQQMAGGDSVTNSITITNAGGQQTRVV